MTLYRCASVDIRCFYLFNSSPRLLANFREIVYFFFFDPVGLGRSYAVIKIFDELKRSHVRRRPPRSDRTRPSDDEDFFFVKMKFFVVQNSLRFENVVVLLSASL